MSILRFLGLASVEEAPARSSAETETVRKITRALERLDPDRARFIAAFAYILSRVARCDLSISQEETAAMEGLVSERGRIPEEQAVIVVQMAKMQATLFGGTENYLVTREFKKISNNDDRIALINCLFSVSSADKSVSTLEESEIRQIAAEIGVEHRDYIAVRSGFREHLAVLKKPEQDS